MARLLLQRGADPALRAYGGHTPLIIASHHGRVDVVSCLLGNGGSPLDAVDSWRGATALCWASDEGHAEVVRLLLQAGADPTIANVNGLTPLTKARERHHQGCVTLLEVRGSRKGVGIWPLRRWVQRDPAPALVTDDRGSDIDQPGSRPFCFLAR